MLLDLELLGFHVLLALFALATSALVLFARGCLGPGIDHDGLDFFSLVVEEAEVLLFYSWDLGWHFAQLAVEHCLFLG